MRKAFVCSASAFSILALLAACSSKEEPTGQLMLSMQTDLSLPKDVNAVRIEVSTFGKVNFAQDYEVGPNGAKIPATLGVVAGANKAAPVRIRIIAKLNGEARLLREAITTVPGARIAMLRMPLQYLSLGQVVSTGSGSVNNGSVTPSSIRTANLGTLDTSDAGATGGIEGAEGWASTCGEGKTADNGACIDIEVDSDTLPDYVPADVFGGGDETGNGTCFDTYECLAQGVDVNIDLFSCAFPSVPGLTNVGLRVPGGPGKPGICSDDPNADCYIPLDAETPAGWFTRKEDNMIVLPRRVCQKFQETKDILSIVYGTTCAPKTPSVPTCGPWSGVSGAKSTPDGGTKNQRDASGPIGGEDGGSGADGSVDPKPWIRVSGGEDNLISLTTDGSNVFYASSGARIFRISAQNAADLDESGAVPPTLFFTPDMQDGGGGAGDYVEIALGKAFDINQAAAPNAIDSILATDRGDGLHAAPLAGGKAFDVAYAPTSQDGVFYTVGMPIARTEGTYFLQNMTYQEGGTYSHLQFCDSTGPCTNPMNVGYLSDSSFPISSYVVAKKGLLLALGRDQLSPCMVIDSGEGMYANCAYYNPTGDKSNARSLAFDGSYAYFWLGDDLARALIAYDANQQFIQPTAEIIYTGEKYGALPRTLDPMIDAQMQWESTSSGNGYLYFSTAGGIRRLPISGGKVGRVEALPWNLAKRAVALQSVGEFVFWTACEEQATAAAKARCEVYRGRKASFTPVPTGPADAGAPNGTADAGTAGTGVDAGATMIP